MQQGQVIGEDVCFVPGECQGPLVGTAFEANAVACRAACEAAAGPGQGCDWFTFHPSDGLCALYDRCPTIDIASCPSCVTGTHYSAHINVVKVA